MEYIDIFDKNNNPTGESVDGLLIHEAEYKKIFEFIRENY